MKYILIALMALGIAGTGFAQEKKTKKKKSAGERTSSRADEIGDDLASYNQGSYGMAGCGLGSMVITDDGFMQIFATTTNGTASNQTFAITSGTSKCVKGGANTAQEQRVFLETNYALVMKDAAQGDGEYIRAFAELLGCNHEAFLQFSRDNYSEIFSTSEPEKIIAPYRRNFGGSCSRISAS